MTPLWKGIVEHIPTKKISRRSDEKWPHSRSPCFNRLTCILHAVFAIIGLRRAVVAHARDVAIVRRCTAAVKCMWIASLVVVADSTVIINPWVGARCPHPTVTPKIARIEDSTLARWKKF